jgi:hypothetical protein
VEIISGESREHIELAGPRAPLPLDPQAEVGREAAEAASDVAYVATADRPPVPLLPGAPVTFELGRAAYRSSEESWDEAGGPAASVSLRAVDGELLADVAVRKSAVVFRARDAEDPRLDNENPEIHSDGVQLHIFVPEGRGLAAWLAIPEPDGRVRVGGIGGAGAELPLSARWSVTANGYSMTLAAPLAALGAHSSSVIGVQLVVNDMAPGRVRRRGQLVLSGGEGERIYLRGDRERAATFLRFVIRDA